MDNIAALIGQTNRPDEQRLAEALRGQQMQGDFLGMSTLQPIAQMGQAMSTRTADAAKTMGGLIQARKEMEAREAENKAAREASIEAARILELNTDRRHQQNLGARYAELNRRIAEDAVDERQKDEQQALRVLKRDDTVEKWERDFGLDTDRFLFDVQQTGIENAFRERDAAEEVRQFDKRIGFDYDKLLQNQAQFDASLGFDYDQLRQDQEQFKTTDQYKRDQLDARVKHWSEQLGYYKARDAADRFQKEDHFTKKMAEDIRQFAKRHELAEDLAAIKLFSAKSMNDWRREKLYFDITGDTGSADYGNMTKIGSKERTDAENAAREAESIFSLTASFDDQYGNVTGLPIAGDAAMGAVSSFPMAKGLVAAATGKDKQTLGDAAAWWSMYETAYGMPERHKKFGTALTEQEQKIWKANTINPNMDSEDIKKRLQNLSWVARRVAERTAKIGHSKGMGKDFLLSTFGFLGDTELGMTNTFEDLKRDERAADVNGLSAEEQAELEELEEWEQGLNG